MQEAMEVSWQDLLELEGINCKGYGMIPKYAMKDRDLSLTAKAIYAYFCSLSGSGNAAFPSRETIQQQLGLGKEAYYNNRKLLEDQGYIHIEKRKSKGSHFDVNLYRLISNPKKYADQPETKWENRVYSLIRHKGLKEAGYGIIPRVVMQDPRLNVKEKGLYAYIASYAGAGASAFPSVKNLILDLDISENSYQKHMKALKKLGYIEVKQRNGGENGKGFSVNDYFLNETPTLLKDKSSDPPPPKNPDTEKPDTANPDMKKPPVDNPSMEKPPMKNPDTNRTIPSANNTSSTNTTSSDYQSYPTQQAPDRSDRLKLTEQIKESIGYANFPLVSPGTNMALVDNLISIMVSYGTSHQSSIVIGKNTYSREEVVERFLRLSWEHIDYVIDRVQNQKAPIRNIKSYYAACLLNALDTMEAFYDQQAQQDL